MSVPRSVLIVGAGLAGSRCAETLRAEGFAGTVVVVGDESLGPYERPALSKAFLAGDRDFDGLLLRPQAFWDERRIQLRVSRRVVAVDVVTGTAATDRGESLEWDGLVIATGARPRRLPFLAPRGVHVLRTAADAWALRGDLGRSRGLAVVGGGFVGAEVASTARGLGLEVTVVEAGRAPFAGLLGDDFADVLLRRARSFGVDVRTSTTVLGFRTDDAGRLRGVGLSDGHEVACETALVAIGVEPVVDLVPTGPTRPVYVCGDAAGRTGHWTDAAASGADTARRLIGLEPLPPQPPFFWSDQFGLRIQLVGDPARAARVELEGTENAFVAHYRDGSGALVAALAANRPEAVGALRRELALAA